FFMYPISDSHSDEDGVIGYHATTVTPAIMQPIAAAALPSMRILPAVSFIGWGAYGSCFVRFASPESQPALSAPELSATALAFLPSCLLRALSISERSMPSSLARMPS